MATLKEQGWYGRTPHRKWRRLVLQRDNYLCQICLANGSFEPARVAHHIKTTQEHPELALDVSNGQSLCTTCHERVHDRVKREEPELPTGVRIIKA